MRLTARAKINWTLDIVGQRADGYHLMDMLMQPVTLADEVILLPADEITLTTGGSPLLPADQKHLAYRAAMALKRHTGYPGGAAIHVEKRIPVGAGMGGGSADAAAVLVGLNRLWGLNLSTAELEAIGLTLGADVPFCIRGGLQRAQGVGERLTPVPLDHDLYLVAFQPCLGLSTKEVFTSLHEDGILDSDRPDNEAAQAALMRGDVQALGRAMGNVLEPVSRRMRPELDRAIRAIEESGACGARMTGSGSAVFGVYRDEAEAQRAAQALRRTYPTCSVISTASCGVVVEEV